MYFILKSIKIIFFIFKILLLISIYQNDLKILKNYFLTNQFLTKTQPCRTAKRNIKLLELINLASWDERGLFSFNP